jgi:hypothetical protein
MFDQIVVLLVALSVIAFPIGLMFGIVWAIKASSEEDKIKKTKGIWISVVCILGPIIFLAITVSLWGLSAVLSSVLSN